MEEPEGKGGKARKLRLMDVANTSTGKEKNNSAGAVRLTHNGGLSVKHNLACGAAMTPEGRRTGGG